jgi:hypothetical protein
VKAGTCWQRNRTFATSRCTTRFSAAVAEGNAARGGIGTYLGRKAVDIAHPINVLENAGLLIREPDVFRDNRSTYRIAEPLITFYHAMMRPVWDQLERPGSAARVWSASQHKFDSQILGPHFEQVCRTWALNHADPDMLGGLPAKVASGTVQDPEQRKSREVDVAVIGISNGKAPLLAIGEAKWNLIMGVKHAERLRRIRELLRSGDRYNCSDIKLLCFSTAGFTDELHAMAASAGDIHLVGPSDLYGSGAG